MGCVTSSSGVNQFKDHSCLKLKDQKSNNQRTKNTNETNESQRRKKINKVEFLNYSETIEPTQNVIISTEQFTVQDKKMLDEILSQNYIFHKLSLSQRKQIIDKFIIYDSQFDRKTFITSSQKNDISDNQQYLFKKGDIGTMFFVIKQGSVEIQLDKIEQNGRQKTIFLSKGDSFGQLALLYKTFRTASVKCLTKCTFLCLSNYLFRQVLQNIVQRTIQSSKILIERIKLFHYLGPKEKNKLANNVVVFKYEKDDVIFRKGQDSLAFFVIVSGGVKIQVQNKPTLQLRPGDYFGQSCFQQNAKRSGTVLCTQKTQLMVISKTAIQKVFGKQFHEFYYFSILKWALKRNPILNLIPNKLAQKLLKESDIIFFTHGHIISKQGQKVQKLYIPIEGKLNHHQAGQIINCQYLVDLQKDKKNLIKNEVSLIKQGQGYVCVIDINRVLSLLQRQNIFIAEISSKQFQVMRKFISSKKELQSAHVKSVKYFKSQASSIRAENLKIVQKISDGQFGPIYKARHFLDDKLYALKSFHKHQVDSYKMRNFVKQQVEVMQLIKQHNFIVNYHSHYQIQQQFLILMQLIDGKDFFDTISQIGALNNQQIQFYFATFILALQFLHENDIIYRDIKPQNAVIEPSGYLKMIDLGTARILSQKNGYRSFTIIGTPHYMAPQVIAGKGYSFQADIWSLGVLLYQLVFGCFPYGQKIQEPIKIYDQIIKNGQNLTYPKIFTQNSTKTLIQRLLIKEPSVRQIQNFSQIKDSQFYEGFQWDKFASKTMKAPFKSERKQKRNEDLKDSKKNSQETLMNFFDRVKYQTKRQNPKIQFSKWDQF